MKCYFCRKQTKKVIRCKSCIGAVKLPTVLLKGSGFTVGSMIGTATSKNDIDPQSGEKVYREL